MNQVKQRAAHALYRFYGGDGALLYVGITLNPGSRWKEHASSKPWWQDVARIEVETHRDRESVLAAERAAIVAERPRYNVVYNGCSPAPLASVVPIDWAAEMPDMCHDGCVTGASVYATYFPYAWSQGVAEYECVVGHRWHCGWGYGRMPNGMAPANRGLVQLGSVFPEDYEAVLLAGLRDGSVPPPGFLGPNQHTMRRRT